MSRTPPPAETGDRAIGFWLKLTSGDATDADRAACAAWRAADPAHEHAWVRLQQGLTQSVGRLDTVLKNRHDTLRQALVRPARRRVLLGAAGLAGAAASGAWVANRVTPLANLTADLGTATGERRQVTLPDGSLLTLDARSRVDLDFAAGARTVHLREGAVIALPRAALAAVFSVRTRHGDVRSTGATYMVRQEAHASQAVALGDGIDIVTRGARRLTLAAGQGARYGNDWIDAPAAGQEGAAAWRTGWLQVRDQPLGDVIAALGRYRAGVLRVSPQAAALEVSGSYPLDDTDRALSALVHTLPLSVRRYTRWLTLIDTHAI